MKINSKSFFQFDARRVPSPCFVVDEVAIEKNLQVLQRVEQESGAKVLLALKAFSMFSLAPLITKYLSGCCASGVNEARLAYEKFNGNQDGEQTGEHKYKDKPGCKQESKQEIHTYSPAYKEDELRRICEITDHLVFNSFSQWNHFQAFIHQKQQQRRSHQQAEIRCGLRINPMLSTGATEIYDPCAKGSRLGITIDTFKEHIPQGEDLQTQGISGLHFHTLCENGFDELSKTLDAVEEQFADYLPHLDWLNLGGGHHITHPDYDVDRLISTIKRLRDIYQVQIYLEPGEAIAIHTGVLVGEVLDLTKNEINLAIIDSSATCHMPDTMEMPYRAEILLGREEEQSLDNAQAGEADEKPYTYRLGGQTCLAGDVMGDYSFAEPLSIGQRIMFDDMSHYTMVKTTTFNGIGLPAIAIWNSVTDDLQLVKEFTYQDFVERLS